MPPPGGCDALRTPLLPRRAALATSAALLSNLQQRPAVAADAAIFAQRFSIEGKITPVPPLGQYSRYSDELSTPKGSKALSISTHFDYPVQFQQIGRALGGIQFVDGNTGLKIYVLRAELPGTSLEETPKKWFGA